MSEDRLQIWIDYIKQGGLDHRIVRHMFVNYNRYAEVKYIVNWFYEKKIPIDFPVLDYGCGVADYGIYLLRQGVKNVDMYDFPRATEFVDYRLKLEGLGGKAINADTTKLNLKKYDMIIFGEVLEHIEEPFNLLLEVVNNQTKYIFTSSYPYRSDDPDDPYWSNDDHDDAARLEMPECRKILEKFYDYTKFEGELRLWVRK